MFPRFLILPVLSLLSFNSLSSALSAPPLSNSAYVEHRALQEHDEEHDGISGPLMYACPILTNIMNKLFAAEDDGEPGDAEQFAICSEINSSPKLIMRGAFIAVVRAVE